MDKKAKNIIIAPIYKPVCKQTHLCELSGGVKILTNRSKAVEQNFP